MPDAISNTSPLVYLVVISDEVKQRILRLAGE